jgi:hypothetical protein
MRDVDHAPEVERTDWQAFRREAELDRDLARTFAAEPPQAADFAGGRGGSVPFSLSGFER